MDRAVTWLNELLSLSLIARNTFRRRSLQERLTETSKFPWQAEETNSFTLEKTTANYEFSNKANRSIEIIHNKETSIPAHAFLSNSSEKDGFRTQNNGHSSVKSCTDSSACFDPSCSRVNLLSEGSNVLKELALHEWEARFADGLLCRRRRRFQFRTQIPANRQKKHERYKSRLASANQLLH